MTYTPVRIAPNCCEGASRLVNIVFFWKIDSSYSLLKVTYHRYILLLFSVHDNFDLFGGDTRTVASFRVETVVGAMALSQLYVHVVGVEVKFPTQNAWIQTRSSWFWRSWQECFGNYGVKRIQIWKSVKGKLMLCVYWFLTIGKWRTQQYFKLQLSLRFHLWLNFLFLVFFRRLFSLYKGFSSKNMTLRSKIRIEK